MSLKFGEKIRQIRVSNNKTLEEVAKALGTSKAYVWQLENKDLAKPSGELLLKIANLFAISPDFLLDDSAEAPNENQRQDAFFRKFSNLSEKDKLAIEKMMDDFDD